MFKDQTDLGQRFIFFLLLALLCILAPIFTYIIIGDWTVVAAVTLTCLVFGYAGVRVALFATISENRVRIVALSLVATVCLASIYVSQSALFLQLANPILLKLGLTPIEQEPPYLGTLVTLFAIITMSVAAVLIIRSFNAASAMGTPARSLDDILPQAVNNAHRIENLKLALTNHLNVVDQNTQWSDSNFVPLQAQVQILDGRSTGARIVELLKALRTHASTRIFVVLGEPGSGKSVAMRKLARDLLRETGTKKRIPIYINLKEWSANRAWTAEEPPTSEELDTFVRRSIDERLDVTLSNFLMRAEANGHSNFNSLREGGAFFFIFDSFDEIPAVMDQDDNSELIERISFVIANYLVAGTGGRGIIASRLYRQPRLVHENRSVFEIRPFTEDRIVTVIKKTLEQPDPLIEIVMTKRPDLGIIARNPLMLNLMIEHFRIMRQAPVSQKEMFETFFNNSIARAQSFSGSSALPTTQVYSTGEKVAKIIFDQPSSGLEVSQDQLKKLVKTKNLQNILDFLVKARIARRSDADGAFSFSHRRFNEYFLVRSLEAGDLEPQYDAILEDSRWRDTMVLYAEIAPEEEALKLLEFAWPAIAALHSADLNHGRESFLRGRRALRFIVEGFRNRPELLSQYRGPLAALVFEKLSNDVDYVELKTYVEAIGLLEPKDANKAFAKVLANFGGWLAESAATSARYLPSMESETSTALYSHIVQNGGYESYITASKALKIMQLGNTAIHIRTWLIQFRRDTVKLVIGTIIVLLIVLGTGNLQLLSVFLSGLVFYLAFSFLRHFTTSRLTTTIFSVKDKKAPENAMRRKRIIERIRPFEFVHSCYFILGTYCILMLLVFSVDIGSLRTLISDGQRSSLFADPQHILNQPMIAPEFIAENTRLGIATITLAFLSVLPFRQRFWNNLFEMVYRLEPKSAAKAFLTILTVVAVQLGFIVLISRYSWIAWFFYSAMALSILSMMILGFTMSWSDFLRLRRTKSAGLNPSRTSIANSFLSFSAPSYRAKYVTWLESASSSHISALRNPENRWPNDKRPQLPRDEASMELARLDARWMGLES